MNIRFSLSDTQIRSVRKHGLEPQIYGPVEGSKNLYYVEVGQSDAQTLIKSVFRWGLEEGKKMGTCKVISMYPIRKTRYA